MTLLRTTLAAATLLALAGCVVAPAPGYYGGPAYYSDGPGYYGAPVYSGGVYVVAPGGHRDGDARGHYSGHGR
jgi:hypothetical protein